MRVVGVFSPLTLIVVAAGVGLTWTALWVAGRRERERLRHRQARSRDPRGE